MSISLAGVDKSMSCSVFNINQWLFVEKNTENFQVILFDFMKNEQYCTQLLLMIRHVIQVVKFQTNEALTVT